ncbi:hypothetical protein Tco_1320742 [Tanacetum coccineum]
MHEDFEYVKSLEKEVDELESEKADFSNIYDLLLEESVSKDEKHRFPSELALQQCKEQMKNNSFKETDLMYFAKDGEQYHEIQDLKAQMQDKNIAISELKKLIEMFKRKGVDTNFEQPSILGKPALNNQSKANHGKTPTAIKSERESMSTTSQIHPRPSWHDVGSLSVQPRSSQMSLIITVRTRNSRPHQETDQVQSWLHKVVSLKQTIQLPSRQELELLVHLPQAMLRTTGVSNDVLDKHLKAFEE